MPSTVCAKTPLSLRVPQDIASEIEAYAAENAATKTDALLHFVRLGLAAQRPDAIEGRLASIEKDLARVLEYLENGDRAMPQPVALKWDEVASAVRDACEAFPSIRRAYVFGSYARGTANASSDIDVRVEIGEDERFNLRDLDHFAKRIEQITEREVDVVSARTIANAALRTAIEIEGVLVYEREER